MTAPPEPTLLDTLTAMVDGLVWQRCGPRVVALATLGLPLIADGLRAAETLTALRNLHTPRTWQDGTTVVCRSCNCAFPCPTAELMGIST